MLEIEIKAALSESSKASESSEKSGSLLTASPSKISGSPRSTDPSKKQKASDAEEPLSSSTRAIRAVEKSAVRIGFKKGDVLEEKDMYFNGPDRDFIKTDEALRLRTCRNLTRGTEETFITYKGPKLDERSSARTEYETGIENFTAMEAILTSLGYSKAFTVEKQRRIWTLLRSNGPEALEALESADVPYPSDELPSVTLCIDSVKDLGSYIELETLTAAEEKRESAVDRLLALLDEFGIPRESLTRKSYLELLFLQSKL